MCLGNCFQLHKVKRIGYSKAYFRQPLDRTLEVMEPRWLVPERGHLFFFSQAKRHMIFELY